jgi:hypothetical protein
VAATARGDLQRPPRTPAIALSAAMTVMLLIFAIFLFTPPQTSPPSIAEIAPQAVKQILEAPPNQALNKPGDAKSGGAGAPTPTPTPSPTVPPAQAKDGLTKPRAHNCINGRQIEDAQAPPCVPYWDPNNKNGGDLDPAHGIFGDHINIVDPDYSQFMDPALEVFFNNRFEFYGRKIRLIPMSNGGGAKDADIAAAQEAQQHQAFASLESPFGGGFYYAQALAAEHIVYASARPLTTEAGLRSMAPYVWEYPMVADRIMRNEADWICNRLAGQNAIHGSGTTGTGENIATTPRSFGVIMEKDYDDNPLTQQPLLDELSAQCGINIPKSAQVGPMNSGDAGNPSNSSQAILNLKQSGVTSVICLCIHNTTSRLGAAATSQGYFPEWLLSSYYLLDNDNLLEPNETGFAADQRQHIIGIGMVPREVAIESQPARQAVREGDPSGQTYYNPQAGTYYQLNWIYHTLLLVASGIQMAGPHLSAQTFADALHRTVFPNPDTPLNEGHVGFTDGGFWMTQDAAEFYYSNSAQGPYGDDGPGAICYVDRGRRHANGAFTRGDPFYPPGGACDAK